MKLGLLTNNNFQAALNKLASQNLRLSVAFKIKSIKVAIAEELKKYEEVRQAALQKWATKNDDGTLKSDDAGQAVFTPEAMSSFVAELNELHGTEVAINTLKLADLGDNVSMTAEEVGLLDSLIVEA